MSLFVFKISAGRLWLALCLIFGRSWFDPWYKDRPYGGFLQGS
jgi:hypothetical protein